MSTYQPALFDVSPRDLQSNETKLENVLDCLNSIPHINQGGCGISALAIYRWCTENGVEVGDRPFVILLNDYAGDEWEIQHNSELIRQGKFGKLELSHIAIEIDGQLIDSTGSPNLEHYKFRQPEQLNEQELVIALDDDGWTSLFKRDKQIPKIEYALGVDLSDVLEQGW